MADLPKRGGPALVGVAPVAIYTAPASPTSYGILRTIQVTNETASTVTFSLGAGTTNADAVGKRLATNIPLPPGSSWEWTGFMPLFGSATAPELLYAISNNGAGVTVTAGIIEGP